MIFAFHQAMRTNISQTIFTRPLCINLFGKLYRKVKLLLPVSGLEKPHHLLHLGSQLSNLWWIPNSVSKGFDTAIRKQCQTLCLLSLAFIIDGRVVKLIKRNRKNSFFANIFIFMVLPGSLFEVVPFGSRPFWKSSLLKSYVPLEVVPLEVVYEEVSWKLISPGPSSQLGCRTKLLVTWNKTLKLKTSKLSFKSV